jgi:phenylalanyl-tRNA synthetase beta chain
MLKRIDIDTDVFFGEINLDNLLKKTANRVVRFSEISRFPAVSRDMALLVDKNVTFAQIEQIARKSGKKLLKEVSLFDVYEGSNLPKGKKSYAVNFVLQDDEKTLTDRQIDEIMQKIRINLEKELGATLR